MSAMEDSESGGEESYNRDNEGNDSPKSESLSRSSSPAPQSPAPQSPSSPQSPAFAQSPSSPQSPTSPKSPASPYDPEGVRESPASPYDPEAVRESPASSPYYSSRSSPSSPNEQKSPPESPVQPRSPSPVNGQQSDHEASDVEMSDAEEAENHQKENDENVEKSDDEGSHSEVEDSEREENIPEVNIDSADENDDNKSDQNASDNEGEQSGDEDDKDEQRSVHVDSEAENKSDDEVPESDPVREHFSVNNDSPQRSSMSPIQTEKDIPESDNEEEIKKPKKDSDAEENADSDSDAESEESEVGGLIADIFGESDDDEEFEGFNEEDITSGKAAKDGSKGKKEKKKRAKIMSDSEDEKDDEQEKELKDEEQGVIEDVDVPAPADDDTEAPEEPPAKKKKIESDDSDDDGDRKMREDFVSDFDLMMQKKKEESSKRRRRRDVDLISDSDDLIADIISQMRIAAEEDKELNKMKRTATKKLKILPMVMSQLKKQDLKMAFLDQGILNVIAEWLTPLPDRSLPHLNIREGMLKQLSDYPNFDPSLLKSSGIGRALMYLYKHPRETKDNRERAGRLITEWARPIFNVTTNYHSLTKEEREQRDYDHIPKKRKMKDQEAAEEEEAANERKDIDKEMAGEKTAIRPGDKGWIGRARVPMPSTKDYVNRPKWNVEMEFGRGPSKKPLTRIEKHMRSLQDKKRISKQQRAITISIEGRKMAI